MGLGHRRYSGSVCLVVYFDGVVEAFDLEEVSLLNPGRLFPFRLDRLLQLSILLDELVAVLLVLEALGRMSCGHSPL